MQPVRENRAFIMEMVLGIVRRRNSLEWIIRSLANHPPEGEVSALLCVGLYQLLFMDTVEAYAAVNETVAAAHRMTAARPAGFVNAILREAQREKDRLLAGLAQQPLDIQYDHPADLMDRWRSAFGEADLLRLCTWNNTRPELIVRVRPMIPPEACLAAFLEANIDARAHAQPGFLVVPTGGRVEQLPGYAEGWFAVQDPATQCAVDLLDPKPGERILDACAAPGGKTIMISDRMEQRGALVAVDHRDVRLDTLRENLKRCGCGWVQVRPLDLTRATPTRFHGGLFDAVLLDTPCSNTGVIRRHPDVRWRITREHLDQLTALQARLLNQAARLVRPGGRLVYSTCSLEHEENGAQIEAFLRANREFRLKEEQRRFPPVDEMDGAFAARLEKR